MPSLTYKFKVGDKVRVVSCGWGIGDDHLGEEVEIISIGEYYNGPGYFVNPPIGNNDPKYRSQYAIGEQSFELIEQPKPIQTKIKKSKIDMAKTKSLSKKSTQDVRSIETSLINKEEVFKMLALAEATGLPLLLTGNPGVNLN